MKNGSEMAAVVIAGVILCSFVIVLVWPRFTGVVGAELIEERRGAALVLPDPGPLQAFYDQVVTPQGVRYAEALGEPRQQLQAWLEQLDAATPARFEDDDQRLALYINAYNAFTIDGVLNRWPIDSVNDGGAFHKFFRKREHRIADVDVSLHGFETVVIRHYDPRLHFALNCASASCPPLNPKVYLAETLHQQLEQAAADFIRNETFNQYDPQSGVWRLSKIFEWYADDFGGEAAVRDLIAKHHDGPMSPDTKIEYLEYDWSLNKAP